MFSWITTIHTRRQQRERLAHTVLSETGRQIVRIVNQRRSRETDSLSVDRWKPLQHGSSDCHPLGDHYAALHVSSLGVIHARKASPKYSRGSTGLLLALQVICSDSPIVMNALREAIDTARKDEALDEQFIATAIAPEEQRHLHYREWRSALQAP